MLVIAEVVATILLALEHWDDKPQMARELIAGLLKLLSVTPRRDDVEAMRGLAAGIAASRANAVQSYIRSSHKTPL